MEAKFARQEGGTRAMLITVLGLGHVGLPTALGLAELGWRVVGADEDLTKITSLREGRAPFYEPGLQELLSKHLQSGRFVPSDDVGAAIRSATVLFVCVGTPQRSSGEADLSQVERVARTIAGTSPAINWSSKKARCPRSRRSG